MGKDIGKGLAWGVRMDVDKGGGRGKGRRVCECWCGQGR